MKKYKRENFLKLPEGTIYSRIDEDSGELMWGLFCKTSGGKSDVDWVEQDLISEGGFPNEITDSWEAMQHQLMLRDSYQDFQTDLECASRDGRFEDSDTFVVWDKKDITKLRDYLSKVLE